MAQDSPGGGSDILRGNNLQIVICGAALGLLTALAASKGYIGPTSAFPAFGWIVIGLLVCELVFSVLRGQSPMQLFAMPARIVALIAGVGVDMAARMVMGLP
jgi:hypothetical protein